MEDPLSDNDPTAPEAPDDRDDEHSESGPASPDSQSRKKRGFRSFLGRASMQDQLLEKYVSPRTLSAAERGG